MVADYFPGMAQQDDRELLVAHIIARRFRAAREKAGIMQEQCAAIAGVSQATISNWENGGALTALENQAHALRANGIDPAVLVGGDDGGLTTQEAELVRLFRALKDDRDREILLGTARLHVGSKDSLVVPGEKTPRDK